MAGDSGAHGPFGFKRLRKYCFFRGKDTKPRRFALPSVRRLPPPPNPSLGFRCSPPAIRIRRWLAAVAAACRRSRLHPKSLPCFAAVAAGRRWSFRFAFGLPPVADGHRWSPLVAGDRRWLPLAFVAEAAIERGGFVIVARLAKRLVVAPIPKKFLIALVRFLVVTNRGNLPNRWMPPVRIGTKRIGCQKGAPVIKPAVIVAALGTARPSIGRLAIGVAVSAEADPLGGATAARCFASFAR
jgi:hypothetical protein